MWNRFLEIIFIMQGNLRLSSDNEVDFRGKGFGRLVEMERMRGGEMNWTLSLLIQVDR